MGLRVNRDDPIKKTNKGGESKLSYSAGIVYSRGSPPGERRKKVNHKCPQEQDGSYPGIDQS
jgi:hypothetical protein